MQYVAKIVIENIFKFISTNTEPMHPQKSQTSSHTEKNKKNQIDPQLTQQKTQFEALLNFVPTIENIKHYYDKYLKQIKDYALRKQTCSQFNRLDIDKKNQILLNVNIIMQALRDEQTQTEKSNLKEIKLIRASFRTFNHDLKNSQSQNENNKQSNQSVKPRKNMYQKLCQFITKQTVIKLLKAIITVVLLVPQYNIFTSAWTIEKGIILGFAIILFILEFFQFTWAVFNKYRELPKQQQKINEINKGSQKEQQQASSSELKKEKSGSISENQVGGGGNGKDDQIQT